MMYYGATIYYFAQHCACTPSPPSGGQGRDEGVHPRVVDSRFAEAPPHPDPLPARGERERRRRATRGAH